MRFVRVCALGIVTALAVPTASGAAGRDVPSVFFISKSENKNQVHYGVRLDERCAPAGASPVYAYWRMLERDAHAVEPLLDREAPAYGIGEQRVVSRGEHGGGVRVTLRALPSRPILVTSFANGQACSATASLVIDRAAATLTSIHAQLRWPFGVDHLLVRGRALGDGRALSEKITPP
jgi:hypothetical protein